MKRQRLFVIGASLLLFLAIGGVIWEAQQRQQIVGKVDAATGSRCAFTLSRSWTRQNGILDGLIIAPVKTHVVDTVNFTSPPPSRFQTFLAAKFPALFHLSTDQCPSVIQLLSIHHDMPTQKSTVNSALMHGIDFGHKLKAERHFLLDGYPATRSSHNGVGLLVNPSSRLIILNVEVPPVTYALFGFCDKATEPQMQAEFDDICRSFRFEKVIAHHSL